MCSSDLDITVIEIDSWMAAPSCGAALADLGANVVKIEPLAGDPMRTMGRPAKVDGPLKGYDFQFDVDNRGKRSIAVALDTDEGAALVRRLSCGDSTPDGLYFRAAAGKITEQADGWYQVNNEWRTRVRSTGKPLLRTQGDRQELLVPASGKNSVIEQEIVW